MMAAPAPQNPTPQKYIPPSRRKSSSESDPSTPSTPNSTDARDRTLSSTYEIRIEGLPETSDEESVGEICKSFGKIRKMFVSRNKETGLCKGHCYVTFDRFTDMKRALSQLPTMRFRFGALSVNRMLDDGKQEESSRSTTLPEKPAQIAAVERSQTDAFNQAFPSLGSSKE